MPKERRRLLGGFLLRAAQPKRAREGLQSGIGNAEGVQPGHGSLAAQFYDLQLTHNGISLCHLAQPEQSIGDGKYRIIAQLLLGIFADQESCRLPTGKKQG